MKKLNVTWEGIQDPTGYLFSFTKSLAAVLKASPYSELCEDIIATSGFAFRMWIAQDLCPSATSIWEFKKQKPWVENGGVTCGYVERLWGQDDIEEARRNEAAQLIKESIDNGIPAVSWDIAVPEWGIITGYDDEKQVYSVLSITGNEDEMPYEKLGKREIPILSVLTITGKSDKKQDDIINDTLKLAISHLSGEEWCENAKGLEAYPALIAHFEDKFTEPSWQMEYNLGTYCGLKFYAHKFFEKYGFIELSKLYKQIYDNWKEAFDIKTSNDINNPEFRKKIADLLKAAHASESAALEIMRGSIK